MKIEDSIKVYEFLISPGSKRFHKHTESEAKQEKDINFLPDTLLKVPSIYAIMPPDVPLFLQRNWLSRK